MSPAAAPVAATRPATVRPRRPLGQLARAGEERTAVAAQLDRILAGGADQGLEVAAFGSSI